MSSFFKLNKNTVAISNKNVHGALTIADSDKKNSENLNHWPLTLPIPLQHRLSPPLSLSFIFDGYASPMVKPN